MDEKIRTEGQLIMGVICLAISLPIGLLAAGCLLSYPDEVWILGLLFGGSFILLFYSGLDKVLKSRKKEKENSRKAVAMQSASPIVTEAALSSERKSISSSQPMVLARWTFSAQEWNAFQNVEKKSKIGETIFLAILSSALFAWVIHDEKDESWQFSFLFGVCFSAFFFGLKYWLSRSTHKVSAGTPVEVIIDQEKVFINGKLFYFINEERSLKEAVIITKNKMSLLEFKYSWRTSQAIAEDSLLIPVPPAKMTEAVWIVNQLR